MGQSLVQRSATECDVSKAGIIRATLHATRQKVQSLASE